MSVDGCCVFCEGRLSDRRAAGGERRVLAVLAVFLAAWCVPHGAFGQTPATPAAEKPKSRTESVRAVCAHLGVGEGAAVGDIGAGRGTDTWTFAGVVGKDGIVYSEEVEQGMVDSMHKEAEKRGLPQIRAVLGRNDDPCLNENSLDLAFMHYVYHHLSEPREMLRGIVRALKPGGYLVVVDRHRGTLRDWVPRQRRREKHFWLAETTVVREAREAGLAFVECADDCWHSKDPFTVVFQRPKATNTPPGDPDRFEPLDIEKTSQLLLPLERRYSRPVIVALGQSRGLIGPILQRASGEGLEIVLEEWATQKEERPPLDAGVALPSVLTENGDPHLGQEPIDVVFFLDSYHLLFHGKTLLEKIHERLSPAGCIYILDRRAKKPLSRRESSHHRQIDPQLVRQELTAAGFSFWFEGPPPAADRFLLVFGKTAAEKLSAEQDPFIAGPQIPGPPGPWLTENCWRLRGLRTADGHLVRLEAPAQQPVVERAPAAAEMETWKIPAAGLLLSFRKQDQGYVLGECEAAHAPK